MRQQAAKCTHPPSHSTASASPCCLYHRFDDVARPSNSGLTDEYRPRRLSTWKPVSVFGGVAHASSPEARDCTYRRSQSACRASRLGSANTPASLETTAVRSRTTARPPPEPSRYVTLSFTLRAPYTELITTSRFAQIYEKHRTTPIGEGRWTANGTTARHLHAPPAPAIQSDIPRICFKVVPFCRRRCP